MIAHVYGARRERITLQDSDNVGLGPDQSFDPTAELEDWGPFNPLDDTRSEVGEGESSFEQDGACVAAFGWMLAIYFLAAVSNVAGTAQLASHLVPCVCLSVHPLPLGLIIRERALQRDRDGA